MLPLKIECIKFGTATVFKQNLVERSSEIYYISYQMSFEYNSAIFVDSK